MAAGFEQFEKSKKYTTSECFTQAFQCKWVAATWYKHSRIWFQAESKAKNQFIAAGKSVAGRWSKFVAEVEDQREVTPPPAKWVKKEIKAKNEEPWIESLFPNPPSPSPAHDSDNEIIMIE
jgi:hypothetical protein